MLQAYLVRVRARVRAKARARVRVMVRVRVRVGVILRKGSLKASPKERLHF